METIYSRVTAAFRDHEGRVEAAYETGLAVGRRQCVADYAAEKEEANEEVWLGPKAELLLPD